MRTNGSERDYDMARPPRPRRISVPEDIRIWIKVMIALVMLIGLIAQTPAFWPYVLVGIAIIIDTVQPALYAAVILLACFIGWMFFIRHPDRHKVLCPAVAVSVCLLLNSIGLFVMMHASGHLRTLVSVFFYGVGSFMILLMEYGFPSWQSRGFLRYPRDSNERPVHVKQD